MIAYSKYNLSRFKFLLQKFAALFIFVVLFVSNVIGNSLLQKIDYSHHIRGGLLGINLAGGATSLANDGDLFSYKLDYGYDGNIVKQAWKDKTSNQDRSWDYSYDPSSRINSASYSPSGTYSMSGITYDKNGNILSLNRNGVDALTYNYINSGNRLNAVSDGITGNTDVGDFRDGNTAGIDYEYYSDGNLKKDLNKGTNLIEYDPFLSKVKQVSFSNGKWVRFEYSGDGTLIKRSNSDGEYWDYSQSIIYKNGSPYQMTTSEGRAVYNGGSWTYEFEYRDHQKNLRISFNDFNGISSIIQSEETDPFGLNIKPLSLSNPNGTNFIFQNQEKISDFNMNINWFKFRPFDPQLGRAWQIDRLSSKYSYWSPYSFSGNRVIDAVEIDGLEPFIITGRSFIPNESVPNPMPLSNTKKFAGDSRNSYESNTSNFRTEQKVKVDFENKKVNVLANSANGSTGYDEKNNVTSTSPPRSSWTYPNLYSFSYAK